MSVKFKSPSARSAMRLYPEAFKMDRGIAVNHTFGESTREEILVSFIGEIETIDEGEPEEPETPKPPKLANEPEGELPISRFGITVVPLEWVEDDEHSRPTNIEVVSHEPEFTNPIDLTVDGFSITADESYEGEAGTLTLKYSNGDGSGEVTYNFVLLPYSGEEDDE